MKIDNTIKPMASGNVAEIRPRPAKEAAAGAGKATDVQLSGLSSSMQSLGESASVDTAKVAEIKQAISEGRFTINVGAIADRLINTAQELIQSQRKA